MKRRANHHPNPLGITDDIRLEMDTYRAAEGFAPVSAYTAHVLRNVLVESNVKHHAVDLAWTTLALIRIAELEGHTPERVFQDIHGEVKARNGIGMALFSGPIMGGVA